MATPNEKEHKVNQFLNQLHKLELRGEKLDLILTLEDVAMNEDWNFLDEMLRQVDSRGFQQFMVSELLTFLNVCTPFVSKIPYYGHFFVKVEKHLHTLYIPQKVLDLLRGFSRGTE